METASGFSSNAEISHKLAAVLFPGEEWVQKEPNIWIAKSRLGGGHKEQSKLYREISHVRLLTNRGSVAYFLPEQTKDEEESEDDFIHNMHADTVIDGAVVELKTISGNRATLGKSFRRGYKQGRSLLKKHGITAHHSVFLRVYTPFSVDSIKAKLAGELKNSTDEGRCICFFEPTEELYSWTYAELRAIVGT
ncbi:hypothetical protein LQZ19_12375 [Treponema primitia]|uniref:hypothetical protein n=1 Tax=Treponema primitia TaxID=88058 RepID=UPI00397F08A2